MGKLVVLKVQIRSQCFYIRPISLDEIKRKREILKQKKTNNKNEPHYENSINSDTNNTNLDHLTIIENDNQDHFFLGFARVFSGTLKRGQAVFKILQNTFNKHFLI
jgi:hypothetical protein